MKFFDLGAFQKNAYVISSKKQWKPRVEVQAYLIKFFPIFIRWLISLYDIAFILDVLIFSDKDRLNPKRWVFISEEFNFWVEFSIKVVF